jgi:hypothetical protein
MSYLNALLSDLRDRKLWPLAAALLVAVVAVPVVLSKSPSAAPVTPHHSGLAPVQVSGSVPGVTLDAAAKQGSLKGGERDPFSAQAGLKTATHAASGGSGSAVTVGFGATNGGAANGGAANGGAANGGAANATATNPAHSNGTSSNGSSSGAGGGGGGSSVVPPVLPVNPGGGGRFTTAPAGLTGTQAYQVTLATSDGNGGFVTESDVPRLSVLPNVHQPLLVELGVLKGGARVLFAVVANASLAGPGSCIPGPLDCEILALAPGQVEQISSQNVSPFLFAVTGLSIGKYASVAAANRARNAVSSAGQRLLNDSTSQALSLFPYEPSLGVVVDQRNLTVGGN